MIVLTHQQEEYVINKVRSEAYKKCHSNMRAFIDCTKDKYFSIPLKCNQLYLEMNACLKQYNNDEALYNEMLALKQTLQSNSTKEQ